MRAPTKKFRRQNAVGYFYVGLPTYARRGLFLGLVRRRAAKTAEGIELRGCDLSERKISRSKLNRKKEDDKYLSSSFFRLFFLTAARSFF